MVQAGKFVDLKVLISRIRQGLPYGRSILLRRVSADLFHRSWPAQAMSLSAEPSKDRKR
jgi:hypothetical protein